MADWRYYIGPWQWVTQDVDSFWAPPQGTAGLVDLRSVTSQGLAGTLGDRPYGFFAVDPAVSLGSSYSQLARGDCREIATTTAMQDAWESLIGHRPSGAMLVDLLFGQLTTGGVVSDDDPVRPLMPSVANDLILNLGGHSVVKRERFRFGEHPHTNKVQDALREQFERHFNAVDARQMRAGQHQRILDYWLDKYRIAKSDWQRLVPPHLRRHVPGPLPHETTITDDFNRVDSTTVGSSSEGWGWTEVGGDWQISSNLLDLVSGLGVISIRAESDLSSDDQESIADCTWPTGTEAIAGPCVRFDPSAETHYRAGGHADRDEDRIFKVVNGSQSKLADQSHVIGSTTHTVTVTADGSTISVVVGSGSELAVTDTAITGFVRTGIGGYNDGQQFDNFQASDLAAGGAIIGTITATSSLAASLTGKGALAGAINGVSSIAATLHAKGALAGSIDATASLAAIIAAKGVLVGTIDGVSTLSGTATGKGSLVGSIDAAATLSAILTAIGDGSISGTISGTSSIAGTLTGKGSLVGSIDAAAALAASLIGSGKLSGSIDAQATLTALLTAVADGSISGAIVSTSSLAGQLTATGSLAGQITGAATLTGSLSGAAADGDYMILQLTNNQYLAVRLY